MRNPDDLMRGPIDPEEALYESLEDLEEPDRLSITKARQKDIKALPENKEIYLRLKGFYEMANNIRQGMSVDDAFEAMYSAHRAWHTAPLVPHVIPELDDEPEEGTEAFYDKCALRDIYIGEFSDTNMPQRVSTVDPDDAGKGLWFQRKEFMAKPIMSTKPYTLWLDRSLSKPYLRTHAGTKRQYHLGFDDVATAVQARRAIKRESQVKTYVKGLSSKKYTFWRDPAKLDPLFLKKRGVRYQPGADSKAEARKIIKKLERKGLTFYVEGMKYTPSEIKPVRLPKAAARKLFLLWADAALTIPYLEDGLQPGFDEVGEALRAVREKKKLGVEVYAG